MIGSSIRVRLAGILALSTCMAALGCGDSGSGGSGGSGVGGGGTTTGTGVGGDATATTGTGQGGGGGAGGGGTAPLGPAAPEMIDWRFDGSEHSVVGSLVVSKDVTQLTAMLDGHQDDPSGSISLYWAIPATSDVVTFAPGVYPCGPTENDLNVTFTEGGTLASAQINDFDCTLTIEEEFGVAADLSGPVGRAIGTLSGTVGDVGNSMTYPVEVTFNLTAE